MVKAMINHTKENILLILDLSIPTNARDEPFIVGLLSLSVPNLSNISISLCSTKLFTLPRSQDTSTDPSK
jgi:hypothetical protein